ncbi:hypothetical protein Acr_22g0001900 [Actinidia rufa]|uniref:Uncharacterized protein n=1 Tax=Actinidia rufa TaxID=165716 RepID=A0A7J0GJ69_9ERIC|nr:hypothetical protein Acr_22g0001900 [Actinidia rufa]
MAGWQGTGGEGWGFGDGGQQWRGARGGGVVWWMEREGLRRNNRWLGIDSKYKFRAS